MDPLMMLVLLIGLIAMFYFSSRSTKKRMAEMEQVRNSVEPGQWVRTGSGMYGLVADVDGEVVILQTPRGEESYWNIKAIVAAEEPPFASTAESLGEDDTALDSTSQEPAEPVAPVGEAAITEEDHAPRDPEGPSSSSPAEK